jgi:hypothetical protein
MFGLPETGVLIGMTWRRGHEADLVQETKHILLRPLFGKLAIDDAVDVNRSHFQIIASPGSARQVAFVFSKKGETCHNLISLGDLIFNAVITRNSDKRKFESLLQSF